MFDENNKDFLVIKNEKSIEILGRFIENRMFNVVKRFKDKKSNSMFGLCLGEKEVGLVCIVNNDLYEQASVIINGAKANG